MGPSELFLHNGKIITLDGDSSVREAIYVRNGRIAAVGDGADLMPGVSPDARRITLPGSIPSTELSRQSPRSRSTHRKERGSL
jgi:predicted amidohydrolase YtcJ